MPKTNNSEILEAIASVASDVAEMKDLLEQVNEEVAKLKESQIETKVVEKTVDELGKKLDLFLLSAGTKTPVASAKTPAKRMTKAKKAETALKGSLPHWLKNYMMYFKYQFKAGNGHRFVDGGVHTAEFSEELFAEHEASLQTAKGAPLPEAKLLQKKAILLFANFDKAQRAKIKEMMDAEATLFGRTKKEAEPLAVEDEEKA